MHRAKDDQCVLVVAGFISRPDDWQSFHTAWMKRLEKDGLSHFHMVDFTNSRKQFPLWKNDEPRRKKLLADLMEIIQAHVYRKFGSMVINDSSINCPRTIKRVRVEHLFTIGQNLCG
jgi:hypothetical protein